MKTGIGPQNLGAAGMNPKSTPCGHSISSPVNKLEDLSGDGKISQKDVLIGRGVIENDGTPLAFQDDISKIQEAASLLEAHNIGSGGGAAPAAPTGDVRAQQAGMAMASMGGGNAPGAGSATSSRALGGGFAGLFGRNKRPM